MLLKKILLFVLLILVCLIAYHYDHVKYGLQQAKGQYLIITESVPIDELFKDDNVPDSIKSRLRYIQAIKKFTVDSLRLNATDNYETFYDQKGKAVLWMLTASPEFEIKAHQWSFPIAGSFDYKGFFNHDKAKLEAQRLEARGLDTEIDEVAAWSTLGWFSDPILSSMLNRSDGKLAELIIHESTHATVFIKGNVSYNENLANYIGKKGAQIFLKHHFSQDSSVVENYLNQIQRSKLFRNYMLKSSNTLNTFYQSLSKDLDIDKKRKMKAEQINNIKWGLLEIGYFKDSSSAEKRLKKFDVNNAYFSGLSTYNSQYQKFDSIVRYQHHGSLKHFIDSIIQIHGSGYF